MPCHVLPEQVTVPVAVSMAVLSTMPPISVPSTITRQFSPTSMPDSSRVKSFSSLPHAQSMVKSVTVPNGSCPGPVTASPITSMAVPSFPRPR